MNGEKSYRQITVSEMAPHVHSFSVRENKVDKIFLWLKSWIENSLNVGKINYGDKLPLKGDLAFHIGVSLGTVQNVFRRLEDTGLIESKQKVGTFIKNPNNNCVKMTSKKDYAIEVLKTFIKSNYQLGEKIFSTRKLAEILELSVTTVQIALKYLSDMGVLKNENRFYIVNSLDFDLVENETETETLAEKIAKKIEDLIKEEKLGDCKLNSNKELADKYKVSIKTIHDSLKILSKKGVVKTRRGNYGTYVVSSESVNDLYNYESVEIKIKHYITEECKAGYKLPSMKELGKKFNVSSKTVKRALDNLAEDGYVTFLRGRYGGTFVIDVPKPVKESYKWLAVSTEYILESEN